MLNSVCCMRLHTYGVVIGWLGAIFSFLGTILVSVALGFADEIAKQIVEQNPSSNLTVDSVRSALVIVLCIYLGLTVINLLSSTMLIVGTVKERHLLLLPWLINNGVLMVFGIIANITIWAQMIGSSVPASSVIPMILPTILSLALSIYLYYGVYSLFKKIQASSELQRPLIPPASQQTNSYPSYTKI
ncbi:uncharacterized protein LOC108095245 [Drosophila ficusphila]|uniref:uncharacterized protein LOC108095245 n=1 Tax=Drosophila ficusphila TaxID=30025 RepID=UPI0007E72399|nr:uncharacterized protein LOC108095245 [Drosophila ficusphila]